MNSIKEVMDIQISNLDFSVRATNCMNNRSIKTLSQLTALSLEEITKIKNMGRKTIQEITHKISQLELTFQMTDKDWLAWGLQHIELIKKL